MKPTHARAFTLVELLVVIAIIGVLVAMTLPAIMASRESGRRTMCRANLAQLLLALQNYENSFEVLPPGVVNPDGPIRNEPKGLHQGWLIPLAPYLDEQNVYAQIDKSKGVYDPANEPARKYWPQVLICPSEPSEVRATSNYAGCHHDAEAAIAADNHGVLFLNSHVRREDVSDGLSHTLFIGEKSVDADDLGWLSGTRATLRNTGSPPNSMSKPNNAPADGQAPPDPAAAAEKAVLYVGGFASGHPGGMHVGFGDASVEFISDDIDLKLWRQMGNRADGELPAQ